MIDLKKIYEAAGFKCVKTYIQSENVIFNSSETDKCRIIDKIKSYISTKYSFHVDVVLLTAEELKFYLDANPYEEVENTKMYITFLSGEIDKFPYDEFKAVKKVDEKYNFSQNVIYLKLPSGYSKTKFGNYFI